MSRQTIFRTRHTSNFTTLPNQLLRAKILSFKARGILAMVLSNREEWVVHQSWLQEQGTEGREAIASGMHELEHAGYAVYQTMCNDAGKIVAGVWTFFDVPVAEIERSSRTGKGGMPCHGKPYHGLPCHGEPSDGFPAAKKEHSPKDDLPKRRKAPKKEKKNCAAAADACSSPSFSLPSAKDSRQNSTDQFISEWKTWYKRYFQQDQVIDQNQYKKVREFFAGKPEITIREIIAIALNAWMQGELAKAKGKDSFLCVHHSKLPGNLVSNLTGLIEEVGWKRTARRTERQYERAVRSIKTKEEYQRQEGS